MAGIGLLHRLGVEKIRFTGGEPTLYKRLPDLVAHARSLDGSLHLGLTTNGLLLPKLAGRLAAAGLDSVNISLDTQDRERFKSITGVDALDRVVAGIEAAVANIGKVKLNCVLIRGVNDYEAEALVRFADRLSVDIRFIEFMPTRSTPSSDNRYIAGDTIRRRLSFDLTPTVSEAAAAARYYRAPDLKIRVGFINPVSHPFCAECDRLRLASDGQLYGCLFSGHAVNLFELLKRGDNAATTAVNRLIEAKQYLGCAGAAHSSDNLPSFISMGG
jgi:cyclic pyranopterin phosphate synthase